MDSFDQLVELAHEAQDSYKKSLEKYHKVSIEQAFMNYYKSRQICTDIQERLDKVEMRKDGSRFGYDRCVYYMAKDNLTSYEYSTLLVLANTLGEASKMQAEKMAEEKQKQSLKQLIKEAIKEMKLEEKPQKKNLPKRKSR